MRTALAAWLAATTIILAACGGSDGSSADSSSADSSSADASSVDGDQGRVIALLLSTAADSGIELDETCVNNTLGELSDDDAKAIADAGIDGQPEVSDEANEIGDRVFDECIDAESYLESQANALAGGDDTIDADCITAELADLTVNEIDDRLFETAFACSSDG